PAMPPSWPASAMAGTAAGISIASSGRASQTSLHREQRTVRPASPRVPSLIAKDVVQWGQTMCMEPVSTVSLPGCYIATVNESETITDAQEFCPARAQNSRPRAPAEGLPATVRVAAQQGCDVGVHVERS